MCLILISDAFRYPISAGVRNPDQSEGSAVRFVFVALLYISDLLDRIIVAM